MSERDPLVITEPKSCAVGTAVSDQPGNFLDSTWTDCFAAQINDTGNTAHKSETPCGKRPRYDAIKIPPANGSIGADAGDGNDGRQDHRGRENITAGDLPPGRTL